MQLVFASDHAGYTFKQKLLEHYRQNYKIVDCGTYSDTKVDYPDVAAQLATAMYNQVNNFAVLICGSGAGVTIAANRYHHLRAVNCVNQKLTKLARKHNNANVICLGARIISKSKSTKLIDLFINTKFECRRHQIRVDKLSRSVK
ncbi:MAG: RpiB/LacA/LacB family sugar-phosphate isomerase [Pseudomonadota bacterium]